MSRTQVQTQVQTATSVVQTEPIKTSKFKGYSAVPKPEHLVFRTKDKSKQRMFRGTESKLKLTDMKVETESAPKSFHLTNKAMSDAHRESVQYGYRSKKEFPTDYPKVAGPIKTGTKESKNIELKAEDINTAKLECMFGLHLEQPKNTRGNAALCMAGHMQPALIKPIKQWTNYDSGYAGYKRAAIQYSNYGEYVYNN